MENREESVFRQKLRNNRCTGKQRRVKDLVGHLGHGNVCLHTDVKRIEIASIFFLIKIYCQHDDLKSRYSLMISSYLISFTSEKETQHQNWTSELKNKTKQKHLKISTNVQSYPFVLFTLDANTAPSTWYPLQV